MLLVAILALAVSLWNLFGNDVACRLADATVAFDDGKRPGASQCRDSTSSGSAAASARGSQSGYRGASSDGHGGGGASPSTPSANATSPAGSSGVQLTSAASQQASGAAQGARQPASLTERIGTALSTVAEHAVDLMEGAIADAFPLTPAIPPGQLKPTFGHEITYGVGQTVASPGRSRLRRRAVPLGRCRCGRHGVGDGRFGRDAHRRDGPGCTFHAS